MKEFHISEIKKWLPKLNAGDEILLSGTVYTARDAAHKKIKELLFAGKEPPFPLDGAVIYYAGPTPPTSGLCTGSFGPTTSSRMDPYMPLFLQHGLVATIGKGNRSLAAREAMKEHGTVYFCAVGGAGALYAKATKEMEIIAFPELGCESVKRVVLDKFPLFTAIDSKGKSIFDR